jgi:RNase H-like domain found in reverse transcriptase
MPVTFNSIQLRLVEKNYLVYEKEFLMIIRALKKWRANLLGMHFFVYTNHKTLKIFNIQKDLSQKQLCWQESLLQYNMTIKNILGLDNSITDILSYLLSGSFR